MKPVKILEKMVFLLRSLRFPNKPGVVIEKLLSEEERISLQKLKSSDIDDSSLRSDSIDLVDLQEYYSKIKLEKTLMEFDKKLK